MDAAFEFFTKLGVPYYCFHDRDMAPEGSGAAVLDRVQDAVLLSRQRMGIPIRRPTGTDNIGHL